MSESAAVRTVHRHFLFFFFFSSAPRREGGREGGPVAVLGRKCRFHVWDTREVMWVAHPDTTVQEALIILYIPFKIQ